MNIPNLINRLRELNNSQQLFFEDTTTAYYLQSAYQTDLSDRTRHMFKKLHYNVIIDRGS